ncbi:MAG: hypothetical protein ACRCZP_10990 [Phycicoccus sp.]
MNPDQEKTRYRDERDHLRRRLDSFTRLLNAAERGGATVLSIDDVRRGLHLPAPPQPEPRPQRERPVTLAQQIAGPDEQGRLW